MKLPYATSRPVFYLNPGHKFVTFDPVQLGVSSMINLITENLITQINPSLQPQFSAIAINGPYASVAHPGVSGTPGIVYGGTQYLENDYVAALVAGSEVPMTVSVVASCTAPSGGTAQTIWGFGAGGSTPTLALQYQSGNIKFTQVSSAGTFTAQSAINSSLHVITCIKTSTTLTLKIDGVIVSTISTVSATESFTTFVVGGLNSNGSVATILTGTIGKLVILGGAADTARTDAFLLVNSGLALGSINLV